MRVKLNVPAGFYLTYSSGALAYPQTFATHRQAERKRRSLGFGDWLIKEVH